MDLFAVLPATEAELALEDGLRRRLTNLDRQWLEYEGECRKGRGGCRCLKLALLRRDYQDGTLASRMESKLRAIVKRIPEPHCVPQFPVNTAHKNYRIDFAYPDVRLGIEAHSIKWHMGEVQWHYDLARHRALTGVGWTLLYYSWDDLMAPSRVECEVRDMRSRLQNRLF
jgi:very-short-patch-repair endonuclease